MKRYKGLPTFKKEKQQLTRVLKELPHVLGQTAVDHSLDNFDREGFSDKGTVDKWAPRKGNRSKDKGKKILVQTSNLKGSVDYEVSGMQVGVVADAEVNGFKYGHVHNTGEGKQPERKFADNSSDIEDDFEKHLDDEMDRIFGG